MDETESTLVRKENNDEKNTDKNRDDRHHAGSNTEFFDPCFRRADLWDRSIALIADRICIKALSKTVTLKVRIK